jgi:O-antigen/teichoic acid export membrane protein
VTVRRGGLKPARARLTTTLQGFGALATANVLSQLLAFGALAYVTRRIGAANLGAYNFASVLAGYLTVLANFGISVLATRDVAEDPGRAPRVVTETLVLRLVLSGVTYVLFVALASKLSPDAHARALAPIVALSIFSGSITLDWFLLAVGRSVAVAVWRVVGQVAYAGAILLFMTNGYRGTVRYAWFNVLGLAITAAGLLWAHSRAASRRIAGTDLTGLVRRARRSTSFAYTLAMISLYATIDTAMLGYLRPVREVGEYAAAYRLPLALVGMAGIWFSVFFPHAADRLKDDLAGFKEDLRGVVTTAIVLGLGISAAAPICARSLMPTLFGPGFQAAATPFALLAVYSAVVLVQVNYSNVLLASRRQRYYMLIITVSTAVVVIMNLLLIPRFGATGASVSTLMGELLFCGLTALGVRRRIGPGLIDGRRIARGVAAAGVAAAATFASRWIGGVEVQVPTAVLTFLLVAFAVSALPRVWEHNVQHF